MSGINQKNEKSAYSQSESAISVAENIFLSAIRLGFQGTSVTITRQDFGDPGVFSELLLDDERTLSIGDLVTFLVGKLLNGAKWLETHADEIYAVPPEWLLTTTVQQHIREEYDSACTLLAMLKYLSDTNIKKAAPAEVGLVLQSYKYKGDNLILVNGMSPAEAYEVEHPVTPYNIVADTDYRISELTKMFAWYGSRDIQTEYTAACDNLLDSLYVVMLYCMMTTQNIRRCNQCQKYFLATEPKQQYCSTTCKAEHERQRVARTRNDAVICLVEKIGNMLRARIEYSFWDDERERRKEMYDAFKRRKDELLRLYRSGALTEDECLEYLQNMHRYYKDPDAFLREMCADTGDGPAVLSDEGTDWIRALRQKGATTSDDKQFPTARREL